MIMYHHHHHQEGSVGLVLVSALDSYQGSLQYYTTTEPRIVRRKTMKTVMRKRRNIGTMRWKRWRRGAGPPKSKSFPVCGKAWMETILQMYFNHISQGHSFCAVESASGVKNNQLTQPLRPNLNGTPIWYYICI